MRAALCPLKIAMDGVSCPQERGWEMQRMMANLNSSFLMTPELNMAYF